MSKQTASDGASERPRHTTPEVSTIATITLDSDEFALSRAISEFPTAGFEIERTVADGSARIIPYIWVRGPAREALEPVLREDPSIATFDLLADLGEEYLYRMEWVEDSYPVVVSIIEQRGIIRYAHGGKGTWRLHVLFPERAALSRAYQSCRDVGISMNIEEIHGIETIDHTRFGLTNGQREALVRAFETGYYNIPQDITADELADELGISHQALSERLHRAYRQLVKNAFTVDDDHR